MKRHFSKYFICVDFIWHFQNSNSSTWKWTDTLSYEKIFCQLFTNGHSKNVRFDFISCKFHRNIWHKSNVHLIHCIVPNSAFLVILPLEVCSNGGIATSSGPTDAKTEQYLVPCFLRCLLLGTAAPHLSSYLYPRHDLIWNRCPALFRHCCLYFWNGI